MNLQLIYDRNVDVLRLFTGEPESTSSSLVGREEVVIDLADDNSRHVVGLMLMGASSYLPLGERGYDADADTLTLGVATVDPSNITENDDIVTYWQLSHYATDSCMEPVGVTIRQASKHLANARQLLGGHATAEAADLEG